MYVCIKIEHFHFINSLPRVMNIYIYTHKHTMGLIMQNKISITTRVGENELTFATNK